MSSEKSLSLTGVRDPSRQHAYGSVSHFGEKTSGSYGCAVAVEWIQCGLSQTKVESESRFDRTIVDRAREMQGPCDHPPTVHTYTVYNINRGTASCRLVQQEIFFSPCISGFPVFAVDQRFLIRVCRRRGGVIRWGLSTLHARTWLYIIRIVVAVTLRLEVFNATDSEILFEQGNIPGVASKDCNNYITEDGNHSTTTGDHLIGEHLPCKPIGESGRRKGFSAHGSFDG